MHVSAALARKVAIFALVLAVGCSPQVSVHGYVPTQADLDTLVPGEDNISTVLERFGRPITGGLIGDGSWYYVQTTISQYTYNPPEVIDRSIVAINFDDGGTVTGMDRYGLEDGRVINLNTRVTETNARKLGILEQLFGNLFRVDAEQLFGN